MIPVTILTFELQADEAFDLGRAPGSSIRGALYGALRTMYDTQQPVTSRHDIDRNQVGWLLRLEDSFTTGGKDVPRPIAIRPPLTFPNDSTTLSFGLSFYGKARDCIHTVISAVWSSMVTLGIGKNRQPFRVVSIDAVDPLTRQVTPLYKGDGQKIGSLPNPPTKDTYERLSVMLDPHHLTVKFLTPTRIVHHGRLCHQPEFRPWFQRLLERIRTISEVYSEQTLWIPFGELLKSSDSIEMVEDETYWYEAWSGSRRDGGIKPVSGFVGQVKYEGDFSTLMPYILVGQALQVGKNTIKGCGWYEIVYAWH